MYNGIRHTILHMPVSKTLIIRFSAMYP
ncbi:hypothetical protein GMOD_00000021 [Pyrenophora seminiperda CCB06]|uniref:Uncharacterized protein n=1 Tax=Pyrenophora seminiperda CCB06 TaxID=1302712 RepID=A0A3M7M676_9PLEO|nr:hypothetical protein GMOD_00000021 [Pyrenophora seminiperda CCB06]